MTIDPIQFGLFQLILCCPISRVPEFYQWCSDNGIVSYSEEDRIDGTFHGREDFKRSKQYYNAIQRLRRISQRPDELYYLKLVVREDDMLLIKMKWA